MKHLYKEAHVQNIIYLLYNSLHDGMLQMKYKTIKHKRMDKTRSDAGGLPCSKCSTRLNVNSLLTRLLDSILRLCHDVTAWPAYVVVRGNVGRVSHNLGKGRCMGN